MYRILKKEAEFEKFDMVFGGKRKNWFQCRCRSIPAAQAIAHDLAIEQVVDGAQIERTISTGDPCDIGDQFL